MSHVATVTIDNTKVSADLTDYVVYVNLADLPASFWDVVANGGGDIRCFKSDDTTELPREVVFCDTSTSTGELHVKYTGTLSSSTDTMIHIYADGSSSEPTVTSTYGRNNVWTAYSLVWHLQGSSLATIINSQGSGNNASSDNGTPSYQAAGKLSGYGVNFDGSNDWIDISSVTGAPASSSANRSLTLWSKVDVIQKDDELGGYGNIGGGRFVVSSNTQTTGSWFYWGLAHDSTSTRIYRNGTLDGTNTSNTVNTSVTMRYNDVYGHMKAEVGLGGTNFRIGSRNISTVLLYDGILDEVRMAGSVALSGTWLATEYNNQNDTSTFYTATAAGGGATGTNLQLNIADSWRTVDAAKINVGDVWKDVTSMSINVGDAWKTIF